MRDVVASVLIKRCRRFVAAFVKLHDLPLNTSSCHSPTVTGTLIGLFDTLCLTTSSYCAGAGGVVRDDRWRGLHRCARTHLPARVGTDICVLSGSRHVPCMFGMGERNILQWSSTKFIWRCGVFAMHLKSTPVTRRRPDELALVRRWNCSVRLR